MPASNLAKQNTETDLSITKFVSRSALLISSSILRLTVQLIIIFLYSRQLSLVTYGIYQSVWLYINVISIVSLFGLPSLLLSQKNTSIWVWVKANKKLFIYFALLVNIIPAIYVLTVAINYTFTIKLLIIIVTILQNISIIAETIAIKNKKEKLVLLSNIFFSASYLICHLIILYYQYSLTLVLTCVGAILLVKSVVLRKQFFLSENISEDVTFEPIGKQWFYLGIYDTISVIFKWLDKWIILLFLSITQFATYFNGSYEIPIFGLMLSAVGNIMLVDLSKNNSPIAIKVFFERSSLLLASIVFPSFCFLFFYNQEFFTLIFGLKYIDAIPVFVICIFVLPIRILNFTAVLQVYKRSDLIVKGAVLDLVIALLLMVLLYPVLKLRGLALAFVLSTYIQAWYYLWQSGKLINKKISYFFPYKKLLFMLIPVIVITGLCYCLSSFLKYPINLISGIIVCLILITFIFKYHYKMNKNNNYK